VVRYLGNNADNDDGKTGLMSEIDGTDDTDDGYTADPDDILDPDETEDPLDQGYTVPERESHSWRGDTEVEAARGESLDQHLAEEEPEIWDVDGDAAAEDPRAGRLVAPDEGAHERVESDLLASDRGRAGNASSSEEAAMHIVDDESPL
jgi:hypothetical protein